MRARTLRTGSTYGALLAVVLAVALAIRLPGLHWDSGALFHPDERKILMVAEGLRFPWGDPAALASADSPWNPHFFSYGSLPIYLLRIVTALIAPVWPPAATLEGSALVGRVLSTLADVGSVALAGLLGRRLFGRAVGLLAAALLAFAPLHIQLSHYYAVDTLLTLLALGTLWLALNLPEHPTAEDRVLLGIAWGAALATKLSALPLAVPIWIAWYLGLRRTAGSRWALKEAIRELAVTGLVALGAFAVLEPYAVLDAPQFLRDGVFEAGMAGGTVDAPYTRQFAGTLPLIYPLWQMVVWSMGLPLGLAGLAGTATAAVGALRRNRRLGAGADRAALILWGWAAAYLLVTGTAYAKFARYMLPVIPILCVGAAWGLVALVRRGMQVGLRARAVAVCLLALVLSATVFLGLGTLPVTALEHPWLRATTWICENVPAGSRILVEHWDDPLPVAAAGNGLGCATDYAVSLLPLYDEDTPAKAAALASDLAQADYVIISSSRLYAAIPRLPDRYPYTSRYYRLLFGERLGFRLVHYEATYSRFLGWDLVHDTMARAGLPAPRLFADRERQRRAIHLGTADESLYVYDHPMPLIFQRDGSPGAARIEALLIGRAQPSSSPLR